MYIHTYDTYVHHTYIQYMGLGDTNERLVPILLGADEVFGGSKVCMVGTNEDMYPHPHITCILLLKALVGTNEDHTMELTAAHDAMECWAWGVANVLLMCC